MKRPLLVLAGGVSILILVVLVRTATFTSKQIEPAPTKPLELDEARAVRNLQRALQIKSISYRDETRMDSAAFLKLHTLFEEAFPRVHAALKREIVGKYSLLYTWPGAEASGRPMLLLAHCDVVPVDPSETWTHPPFSGELADGYVWGRGALDDKCSVLGILEAVEALLAGGFKPRRPIYLAFGHDEEVSGVNGAGKIAKLLESRGVTAEFSLDEGLAIVEGIVPGGDKPVALIGTAEKGYLTLELTATGPGGHSSAPPRQTALGVLSTAVARLEAHPFPARIEGPVRQMFDYLGPEMNLPMRMAMANLWLFAPLVKRELDAGPATAAALRTTTAVTLMRGGVKENVLPTKARAAVNFRLMPGDTVEDVIAHVKRRIADSRIQISVLGKASEASPIADVDSPSFELVNRTIRQVFGDVLVAPGLDIGATDSRHYPNVAENLYRFAPLWFCEEDLKRVHGKDERISKDGYIRCVRFFAQLIRNAASSS